jgi:hypothetical protein
MTIGAYLRALRVTLDEVLVELDDESELMTVGSDDEFDDMTCSAPAPPTQASCSLTCIDVAPFTQSVSPTVTILTSPLLEVFHLYFADNICSFIVQ